MEDAAPSAEDLARLRGTANYQFGRGAGEALLPADAEEAITVTRTKSGRIEQCFLDGERLFTMNTDGRFVLSVAGGRRLAEGLEHPRNRVVVGEESVDFVRDGRNAFAKFVREVDPELRPYDEALVVYDGELLGVGRAELSPTGMADFETGVAVAIRHGAGD